MTKDKPLWHENKHGNLVKCPAKIKCRLGGEHYPAATKDEAESAREEKLNKTYPLTDNVAKAKSPFPTRDENYQDLQDFHKILQEELVEDEDVEDAGNLENYWNNQFELGSDVVWQFTNGDCLNFAEQLQKKIGGEIVGVGLDPTKFDNEQFDHCYVLKDGVYWDVRGKHYDNEIFENYDFSDVIIDEERNNLENHFGLHPIGGFISNSGYHAILNGRVSGAKGADKAREVINGMFQSIREYKKANEEDDSPVTFQEAFPEPLPSPSNSQPYLSHDSIGGNGTGHMPIKPDDEYGDLDETMPMSKKKNTGKKEVSHGRNPNRSIHDDNWQDYKESVGVDFKFDEQYLDISEHFEESPYDQGTIGFLTYKYFDTFMISDEARKKDKVSIPIDDVQSTQDWLDASGIARYLNLYEAGGDVPEEKSVVLGRHEGKIFVLDGHHRVAAAKLAGLKELKVHFVDYDAQEAIH